MTQFDFLVSQFTVWYFNRFKIDLFNFHSFTANISTKWNAQGGTPINPSQIRVKLKFGSKTNSNMQISMVMLTFSVFDWKHPVWANLVQKMKIVSLGWNLVSRLIRICITQWWCSLFCFRPETPFLGKFGPKKQNC